MLAVGAVTVFLMLTFFLPRIVHVFEHTHQALPWPTQVLMAISGFFLSMISLLAGDIPIR